MCSSVTLEELMDGWIKMIIFVCVLLKLILMFVIFYNNGHADKRFPKSIIMELWSKNDQKNVPKNVVPSLYMLIDAYRQQASEWILNVGAD